MLNKFIIIKIQVKQIVKYLKFQTLNFQTLAYPNRSKCIIKKKIIYPYLMYHNYRRKIQNRLMNSKFKEKILIISYHLKEFEDKMMKIKIKLKIINNR